MEKIIAKFKEYALSNNWMVLAEIKAPQYSIDWITPQGNHVSIQEYFDHPDELWLYGVCIYPE
uniref:Uncharacterized protein n=1 Tax=viral metagenome TaxID=1070528 RepID=A0A6M3KH97_9ZZZZ